jgi:hypothetical protein
MNIRAFLERMVENPCAAHKCRAEYNRKHLLNILLSSTESPAICQPVSAAWSQDFTHCSSLAPGSLVDPTPGEKIAACKKEGVPGEVPLTTLRLEEILR